MPAAAKAPMRAVFAGPVAADTGFPKFPQLGGATLHDRFWALPLCVTCWPARAFLEQVTLAVRLAQPGPLRNQYVFFVSVLAP